MAVPRKGHPARRPVRRPAAHPPAPSGLLPRAAPPPPPAFPTAAGPGFMFTNPPGGYSCAQLTSAIKPGVITYCGTAKSATDPDFKWMGAYVRGKDGQPKILGNTWFFMGQPRLPWPQGQTMYNLGLNSCNPFVAGNSDRRPCITEEYSVCDFLADPSNQGQTFLCADPKTQGWQGGFYMDNGVMNWYASEADWQAAGSPMKAVGPCSLPLRQGCPQATAPTAAPTTAPWSLQPAGVTTSVNAGNTSLLMKLQNQSNNTNNVANASQGAAGGGGGGGGNSATALLLASMLNQQTQAPQQPPYPVPYPPPYNFPYGPPTDTPSPVPTDTPAPSTLDPTTAALLQQLATPAPTPAPAPAALAWYQQPLVLCSIAVAVLALSAGAWWWYARRHSGKAAATTGGNAARAGAAAAPAAVAPTPRANSNYGRGGGYDYDYGGAGNGAPYR